VRRAEAMRRLLLPCPAGVRAALRAAPHADVVFAAHTCPEHLNTVRDVRRYLPMGKSLYLRWWLVPAVDVPRDATEQTEWLYHWWETIDAWIENTQREEAAKDGGRQAAKG
jgi:hypothetical protein